MVLRYNVVDWHYPAVYLAALPGEVQLWIMREDQIMCIHKANSVIM